MQIREEALNDVCVISASGRLDSGSAGDLEAVLPARVREQDKVLLDLGEVAYVSSAGLRVLLLAAKAARSTGHRLVLCGLGPSVREVFDISGFTALFVLEADRDSALAALA
jgi:anti-sigma B factor antagonist